MQETSTILAEYLTSTPFNRVGADRNNAAMDYLLTPITNELMERSGIAFSEDKQWRWFDCYPAPKEFDPEKVVSDSFLDLSLPLDTVGSLDGIVINLELVWLNYERIFSLCLQWLKPGGQLFFSSFGPDTLFELRQAWTTIDQFAHVHDFPDLHSLGDQLSKTGFEKPILDTDWQGVEFEDIDLLVSDLRRQGCTNRHRLRRRELTGKSRMTALRQFFSQDPSVQMTFEIIYGYAKAPQEKRSGIQVQAPFR